jgi:hypothetical protein
MTERTPSALGEEKGWRDLLQLDPLEVCRRSLVTYDESSRKYTLRVLIVDYDVMLETRAIMPTGRKNDGLADPGPEFRIMVLDYLVNCKELSLSGRLVSGAQLKAGEFFFRGTHGLELDALTNAFGNKPEQFKNAGLSLGGRSLELGDASFQLPMLPRIPITYVLWAADEEFSARLSVLFDSTADSHMHLDTVRTAVTTANKFLLAAKPQ